jgi:tetratricopeptide (TPR) repeat protein
VLMKIFINKIIFFAFFCIILLLNACTNTPWHREKAEVFLNKGISFIEVKQYNNALKDLLESEKYYADDPKLHYYLGLVYHTKGMKQEAMEEFQRAIELRDNYSEAHNYLGTLYLDDGLWDKAITEFEKALSNPVYDTPAVPLYNEGWAYYLKKDYKNALDKYRAAINKEPMTVMLPQIDKNIGLVYFDQSNAVEAIKYFKKSVELNPYLYDAQFYLGECYLQIKDKMNAKKAFQAVIKLSPQSSFGQKAKTYLQTLK